MAELINHVYLSATPVGGGQRSEHHLSCNSYKNTQESTSLAIEVCFMPIVSILWSHTTYNDTILLSQWL